LPPEADAPKRRALPLPLTGRCYCGAAELEISAPPLTVAYCHCGDCRRWTGAPVAAFSAFTEEAVHGTPPLGAAFSITAGVERWTCGTCGSPLAARFDYLPGQIYIPLGILDQAADLGPELHCHDSARLPWLHLADNLPRSDSSAREGLIARAAKVGR